MNKRVRLGLQIAGVILTIVASVGLLRVFGPTVYVFGLEVFGRDLRTENPKEMLLRKVVNDAADHFGLEHPAVRIVWINGLTFSTRDRWDRAVVVVSDDLFRAYSDDDLAPIAGHELAHIFKGHALTHTELMKTGKTCNEKQQPELEADLLGAKVVGCKAMIGLMTRWNYPETCGSDPHPSSAQRILNLRKHAENCPSTEATANQ